VRPTIEVVLLVAAIVASLLSSGTPSSASDTRFCAEYKRFQRTYAAHFVGLAGLPTPESIVAGKRALDARLTALDSEVPRTIAGEWSVVSDLLHAGVQQLIDVDPPSFYAALEATDNWAITHCGYHVIDVTASDSGFSGLPKKLKPGFHVFDALADGTERVNFAIVHLLGDETPEQLGALSEAELLRRVEIVAPTIGVPPDMRVANFAWLTRPGRYAAVDPTSFSQTFTVFRVGR
jgi:hypothetical protein